MSKYQERKYWTKCARCGEYHWEAWGINLCEKCFNKIWEECCQKKKTTQNLTTETGHSVTDPLFPEE